MKKLFDFHKPEEIRKLFESYYSEEVINQIKDFYFNGQNLENDTTALENICHVSTFVNCKLKLYFKRTYKKLQMLIFFYLFILKYSTQ